jgi:hypothetical protein
MNRTLLGTLAAVTLGVALVAAQDPQTPASRSADQKATTDKAVTYAGCLEAGAAPGTYMLSNATEVKAGAPTSPNAPAANPAAPAATTAGTSFKIAGTVSGFDLASNVNHKVQVTGMVSDKDTPTAAASASPAMGQASAVKTITIATARSLADRCANIQ